MQGLKEEELQTVKNLRILAEASPKIFVSKGGWSSPDFYDSAMTFSLETKALLSRVLPPPHSPQLAEREVWFASGLE